MGFFRVAKNSYRQSYRHTFFPHFFRDESWPCNARESDYRYNGIGLVSPSDELERWHTISALIYLTKNSQSLGDDVPFGTRALTKGQHKPRALETRGRPRQIVVLSHKRIYA